MAKILDGRVVRDKIEKNLKKEISRLRSKPKLVIVQVGDLAQSNTYIRQKNLFGQKIGAAVDHQKFDEKITQTELISHLLTLNSQLDVHGIIIQLPLPKHLDRDKIIEAIDSKKDVDGQTSTNVKFLFEGSLPRHPERSEGSQDSSSTTQNDNIDLGEGFIPATTKGIMTLLNYYKIPIAARKVVVVGRSSLVGKPTALALLNRDATVTICHRETKNLKEETKRADILIVAVGKPKLITKDHVSRGQVVIDVGINVVDYKGFSLTQKRVRPSNSLSQKPESEPLMGKLVGDVDSENVKKIVAAITPVPGGVGPLTVASLFENLFEAFTRQNLK